MCTCKRIFQTSACMSRNQCKPQQVCVNFLSRDQFWCVDGLKRASPRALSMRIGYLSFHLNWLLSPFAHCRLQTLQTNEVTFAHVITPLMYNLPVYIPHQCIITSGPVEWCHMSLLIWTYGSAISPQLQYLPRGQSHCGFTPTKRNCFIGITGFF